MASLVSRSLVSSTRWVACAGSLLSLLSISCAEAAVGRTPGSFDISSAGSAVYSIPIFTPPGPRGVQPSIALVYDSSSRVGPLGRGWSLSGFSSMMRCKKTVAQDGVGAPISNWYTDAYCLDGNRLRHSSGTYGQGTATYLTEIADFSVITGSGTSGSGHTSWTVQHKDGLKYTYGGTSDSRVLAYGYSTVHQWMVSQIEDAAGNKVKFHWKTADGTTYGTTHPTKIEWTQTSASSGSYVYSMDFHYAAGGNAAASVPVSYMGNHRLDTDLLTSITVSTSGVLKRNYMLTYTDSPTTGAKRLAEVKECADAGPTPSDCLSPTAITYQNGTAGMSTGSPMLSVSGATAVDTNYDFDGNGIKDVAYQLSGTWYVRLASQSGSYYSAISTGLTELRAGKLRGNNKDQLLGVCSGTWYMFDLGGSVCSGVSTGVTTAASATDVVPADVDADGRDDLVYVREVDTVDLGGGHQVPRIKTGWRRNLSTGGYYPSFASPVDAQQEMWYLPSDPTIWNFTEHPYYVTDSLFYEAITSYKLYKGGDMNGDGRQELNLQFDYAWYCIYYYYSWCSGSTTANATVMITGPYVDITPILDEYYYPMNPRLTSDDINRDGCDDFILPSGAFMLGCGGGLTDPGYSGAADYTGDGVGELLYVSGSTLHALPFWGYTTGTPQNTGVPATSACVVVVTDGNGDGLDDFGCLIPGTSLTLYAHNGTSVLPDLVSKFEDGYGVKQEITYGSLAESAVYTPGNGAVYPLRDLTGRSSVVKAVNRSDGNGSTFASSYTYHDALLDAEGRGFQGFNYIDQYDGRDGSKYRRWYSRQWPYGGALSSELWYQPNGYLLKTRSRTLADVTLSSTPGSQRYFVYPSWEAETFFEPGGTTHAYINSKHTAFSYDSTNGNLTSTTTWTGPHSAVFPVNTTAYTYAHCGGYRYVPASQTVTHQAPGMANIVQYRTFIPDYANCRISSETFEPSSSTLKVVTSYDFDDFGNVDWISVTGRQLGTSVWEDMTARTTQYSYGTTGQFPVSETNPLGQQTTRTFHPTFGSLLTETDPNGIVVANNTYDSFGKITTQTASDGTYAAYSYGWLSSCCNPRAVDYVGVTRYASNHSVIRGDSVHRDMFGRVLDEYLDSTTGSGHTKLSRTYDTFGRVASEGAPFHVPYGGVHTPAFSTTYTYDLLDRLLTQSRPQSESVSTPVTTTIAYSGLTQTVTDPQGKQSIKVTDPAGRLLHSADHDGYAQNFSYDPLGNLLEVTDFDPTTSSVGTLFEATYSYGIKPFQIGTADMDLGSWSYAYNSLGELVAWSDANTNTFSQSYDALSRVVSRVEPEGTMTFAWGAHAPSHNIGRLYSVSMPGYAEYNYYDSSGRLVTREEHTDQNYTFDYTYNNQGLLDTISYPASTPSPYRLRVKHGYEYGILKSVSDWSSGSFGGNFWVANTRNVSGAVTEEAFGNGVVTNRHFDVVNGSLSYIRSAVGGGNNLQNLSYAYDNVGNVIQRQESYIGLTENFCYDNLHRLTEIQLGGTNCSSPTVQIAYDVMGNITSRTDVNGGAGWAYHGTKKHAVIDTGSGGSTFAYDYNGNMTNRGSDSITWSSYNYPTQIATPTETSDLYYGPDRQYYKQVYAGPGGSETTHYAGGLLEKVSTGSATEWRHRVAADGKIVAIVTQRSGGSHSVYYPLGDNQGSGSVLTDSSGGNLVRQSYEPFGLLRDGSDWSGAVPGGDKAIINGISRRGYTGHSMLGDMGLIHMNGRMYDARLGRFASPDPFTPHPAVTQSYNRYAYVRNNPLRYIDPSGFEDLDVLDEVKVRPSRWEFDKIMYELSQGCRRGLDEASTFFDACLTAAEWRENHDREFAGAQDVASCHAKGGEARIVTAWDVGAFGGCYSPGARAGAASDDLRTFFYAPVIALAGIGTIASFRAGLNGPRLPAARALPELHMGQQGKHIIGHPNYVAGRSVLSADPARLAQRAGTGTPANNVARGQPGFRERVDFGEIIGDYVKDGVATPTTNGIIHYGTKGIHIVPAAP